MIPDIVYMLCPYLDLESLFSLAEAYPEWLHIILNHMRKRRKLKVRLWLECEANTVKATYHVQCSYDSTKMISKPLWKYGPYQALNVSLVYIVQRDSHSIPEHLYTHLADITTPSLMVRFHRRDEARRVLRTITLKSHSDLALYEESIGPDKEPILGRSQIALFKKIGYTGDMGMLYSDLLEALDTETAIVRYEGARHGSHASWLASAVEKYSAANPNQLRCVRRNAAEYEIENSLETMRRPFQRVPEGGAIRVKNSWSHIAWRCLTFVKYQFLFTSESNTRHASRLLM